jgi:hypothetical protein
MNTFIKSSIKNTFFLDPEFRNRSDVGQIALDFLLTVNNDCGVVVMDMVLFQEIPSLALSSSLK